MVEVDRQLPHPDLYKTTPTTKPCALIFQIVIKHYLCLAHDSFTVRLTVAKEKNKNMHCCITQV